MIKHFFSIIVLAVIASSPVQAAPEPSTNFSKTDIQTPPIPPAPSTGQVGPEDYYCYIRFSNAITQDLQNICGSSSQFQPSLPSITQEVRIRALHGDGQEK